MNARAQRSAKTPRRILVIDVGGTHVKFLVSGQKASGAKEARKIDSGPSLTAGEMVHLVKAATQDWQYDAVSIGYPGPVIHGHPLHEPHNLGRGWVGFPFRRSFGCPVRIWNDAAMQALGSYRKGRMLFLGLGTGLGSAMIVDGIVEPMELAHLPYRNGKTYEDYTGIRGLERLGRKKWEKHVFKIINQLREALEPDEVVVGGGNARKLRRLPARVHLGANENAFQGGVRMWEPLIVTRNRA